MTYVPHLDHMTLKLADLGDLYIEIYNLDFKVKDVLKHTLTHITIFC